MPDSCTRNTALRLSLCTLTFLVVTVQTVFGVVSASEALPAIASTKSEIEASDLDDAARQTALSQVDAALSIQREADDLARQIQELQAETSALPARMKRLQEALTLNRDQALEQWAASLPSKADAETLERVLERERDTVIQTSLQIDSVERDRAVSLSRPDQATNSIGQINRRIEELSVATIADQGEPELLARTRELRRISELRRASTELALRQLEQDTAANRQRLYELTLNELNFRRELQDARIELLQTRITDTARSELESLIARVAKNAAMVSQKRGSAATEAAENLQLGNELLQQNEQLSQDRRFLIEREQARLSVRVAFQESRTRLDLAGPSEAVGRWLWGERRRLDSPTLLAQQLEELRGTLAEVRLRRLAVTEQKQALVDTKAAARAMVEALETPAEDRDSGNSIEAELERLLAERAELLALLDPILQRRIAALEQSHQALAEQADRTLALRQLFDRQLFWFPSHPPLDSLWIQRVPEGLYDLVKPSRMRTTFTLVGRSITHAPQLWIASLLLMLLFLEMRRRAPRHITAQAAVTRQIRKDSFGATARALGWTLIAALPGPAAVFLFGNLLQSVGNPGRYSDSLGRALISLTIPLFTVQLLRWTAIERGLGHAHFRWLNARRNALLGILPIAAAVILSMYFIALLAVTRNLDLPIDVQARLAILIACCTLAWSLWRLLDAGQIWVTRGVEVEPSSVRKLLRIALPGVALTVVGLAMTGYVYSAGLLFIALLNSFTLVVAVVIVTGLLARWFLLGERRLAWSRLEEKRAAVAEDTEEPLTDIEPDLSLEQVSEQTGRLLRAIRIALLAVGMIWVWAAILPAAFRLDDIVLWHFSDVDTEGMSVLEPVTLLAALLGVFALTLTWVAGRNLPGLIEVVMQSYTRIDAGSRYATTSILRYAITIVGVMVALGQFGMRWGQLQWLAAALTVGLGFGLQEIFANFVSGLILLFERPFRIGDIITVGDLSGKVTRIRTRATTILDFDNKEIVVPNKNFITGQVVNWTLSDATTRIIVKVGVAYGTNPGRVHELLRLAAKQTPLVLVEPEPQSWFLAFGASSLDFELRVFVAAINDRLRVQDQLNTRIDELFKENDIEIAFPQVDLHVRDMPSSNSESSR